MKYRLHSQQGMTFISFVILMLMIGTFVLVGLKLTPIYLEHFKVVKTLENLENEAGLSERSPKEIAGILQKRWDINGIDRITAKDNVTVERADGGMVVHVEYEVEEPIIANISALVKFDDSVTVGGGSN
jgi:hypothetical protein